MYVASEHPSIPQDVWMTLNEMGGENSLAKFWSCGIDQNLSKKMCIHMYVYIYNHTWFAEDVELIKTSCTCAWKSLDLHKNPGLHFLLAMIHFGGSRDSIWFNRLNRRELSIKPLHPSHEPIPVVSSPPSLLRKFFITRDAWWSRAMSGDVCKPGEPPLNNWKKCGEAEFNVVKLGVILV